MMIPALFSVLLAKKKSALRLFREDFIFILAGGGGYSSWANKGPVYQAANLLGSPACNTKLFTFEIQVATGKD